MKYKIFALLLGVAAAAGLALSASAAQTHEVPVTLTVVNTQQRISVTVPASLPVSVVDGVVVTATNAAVRNTAEEGAVRIAAVTVNDGALTVGDYENFDDASGTTIALELNGCPTRGAGALTITEPSPVLTCSMASGKSRYWIRLTTIVPRSVLPHRIRVPRTGRACGRFTGKTAFAGRRVTRGNSRASPRIRSSVSASP